MEPKQTSPLPKKRRVNTHMDFPDAMRAVIAGDKVTKIEWNNPDIYLHLADGWLSIHKEDGDHPLKVSKGDMLGEDWVVVRAEDELRARDAARARQPQLGVTPDECLELRDRGLCDTKVPCPGCRQPIDISDYTGEGVG